MVIAPAELVERVWARDATLWTGADEARWLGWLDEPMRMRGRVADLLRFAEEASAPGAIETVVLLGMGGSSPASEVLKRTFEAGGFHVLDTSSPTGWARATCTRRGSCTRAAHAPASSCRSSTIQATRSRSRDGNSASGG